MPMISYVQDNCTFTHRTAVLITDGPRVLLHKAETNTFWCLPGGRVELMEDSLQALQREMREEMCEMVAIERLLWIVENLVTEGGRQTHELGLYYLGRLQKNSRFLAGDGPFYGTEAFESSQPLRLIFQWFPIDAKALQKEVIYPVFLRTALLNLPLFPEHILNIETEDDPLRTAHSA